MTSHVIVVLEKDHILGEIFNHWLALIINILKDWEETNRKPSYYQEYFF